MKNTNTTAILDTNTTANQTESITTQDLEDYAAMCAFLTEREGAGFTATMSAAGVELKAFFPAFRWKPESPGLAGGPLLLCSGSEQVARVAPEFFVATAAALPQGGATLSFESRSAPSPRLVLVFDD